VLKMRVIPCLDVKAGRVVKGVNFIDLVDAGDPVAQAKFYDREGADELCFLDITASAEGRDTLYDVVGRTAEQCFMPLTVGGGVRTVEDVRRLLLAGGITVLASYVLAQLSGAQVPGRDIWPICTPEVFNNSAWSRINPFAVHWDSTLRQLTQGDVSVLLPYASAILLQLVVPVAFALLGWRLLARSTPVRLRWRPLVILYCAPKLLLAMVLYCSTTWFSVLSGHHPPAFSTTFVVNPMCKVFWTRRPAPASTAAADRVGR